MSLRAKALLSFPRRRESKGVQREFLLVGAWGYPPAIFLPPLLEERGTGGEVNNP